MKEGRILWIVLLAIVLAACCCAATVGGLLIARGFRLSPAWIDLDRVQASAAFERTFTPQQPVSLTLDVPLGDVTIQAGATDQVTVQASLRAWGPTQADAQAQLDQIDIRAEQDGQRVLVATSPPGAPDRPSGVSRTPQIEVLITVPAQTALLVETEVGRLTVSGLRGDVTITAGVGEVSLTDLAPVSRVEVWSRVGNVELEGPLASGVAYDLASDVGRIALRIPRNSAFVIAARSDLGSVDLGFPLVGRSERDLVGREVRGEVGDAPTTTLTLRSRVGAISVQPQP